MVGDKVGDEVGEAMVDTVATFRCCPSSGAGRHLFAENQVGNHQYQNNSVGVAWDACDYG